MIRTSAFATSHIIDVEAAVFVPVRSSSHARNDKTGKHLLVSCVNAAVIMFTGGARAKSA